MSQIHVECPCGFSVTTRGWGREPSDTAAMMYEAHLEHHVDVTTDAPSHTKKSNEPKPFAVGFQREG